MRRARTAFPWKDVSAERPSTLARVGVAVIEGGVISFVRADHIGRPVFATNATGVKTWTATYTPFGGVHTSTGAPPSARFPGQWFQSESGLHQNWMRDYDPTTGRYLQADPLGCPNIPNTDLTPTPNPLTQLKSNNPSCVDTPPQIPSPAFRPSWNA